ncbi:MAG: prephenate dehydrogenase/arogenate dehydrogenase family protein [Acidimicrobiales bacterium]|nr:prephenate dehydrogenase/arogenate dehydrogenase family protein [Acidimicrobiia bacterium]NNC80738.1 prephenate dehydrogenase/arogenate dehydrogenase family protein [Acidimicrobiales bacterium]
MSGDTQRVAGVIGLGLIGGSVAVAMKDAGYEVWGVDADPDREREALANGIIDHGGIQRKTELTIIATPVDSIAKAAQLALAETDGWVTDTGSVKARIASEVEDPRFVPGHPMAGSEQSGLSGARGTLFRGAAWVLTPTPFTADDAFGYVRQWVASLGADAVTLEPESHDRMVATVSHVPHLAAAALMNVADEHAEEHSALLRLAAGGFRDMTRIAAGSPDIWPPICLQNRSAITTALDSVLARLTTLREAVDTGDSSAIRDSLAQASRARLNLPGARTLPAALSEVRVRIKDRSGELARLTALAAELDTNIFDLEIAHSAEGPTGVIVLLVDTSQASALADALRTRDYQPSVRPIS